MKLNLLSRLELFVFRGEKVGFKYLWEVVMDPGGGVGMGWGWESRTEKRPVSQDLGTETGRKKYLRSQIKPEDFFKLPLPYTHFLFNQKDNACTLFKKIFSQKTQKGIQWKTSLLSSPRPPVPSIFLQRHPTVNSFFCGLSRKFLSHTSVSFFLKYKWECSILPLLFHLAMHLGI